MYLDYRPMELGLDTGEVHESGAEAGSTPDPFTDLPREPYVAEVKVDLEKARFFGADTSDNRYLQAHVMDRQQVPFVVNPFGVALDNTFWSIPRLGDADLFTVADDEGIVLGIGRLLSEPPTWSWTALHGGSSITATLGDPNYPITSASCDKLSDRSLIVTVDDGKRMTIEADQSVVIVQGRHRIEIRNYGLQWARSACEDGGGVWTMQRIN